MTIPGPKPSRLLGWRGNAMRYFRNPIEYMISIQRAYGNTVCLAQGGNSPLLFRPPPHKGMTLFAFGSENNREILTQPNLYESGVFRGPDEYKWLVQNMGSANREHRSRQRAMIVPAFKRDHLKAFHGDIVAYVDRMLDRWRELETVDLTIEFENLAADVASKAFYGQDPVTQGRHQTLAGICRDVNKLLFSPATRVRINIPGSPYNRFLDLAGRAGEAIVAEIERKREAGLNGHDVLSIMIKAHDEGSVKLSETELVGNAYTLFLAGHDVPANALGLTFLLLCQHPGVMADLVDEIEGRGSEGPLEFQEVWTLSVLDSVIRESLRILCPAILIFRKLTSAATLRSYDLQEGSEVFLSPYMTHVDPEIYSDPKRFLPRRWESSKPTPFEFLPFSYGARKCLGAPFAEMLLKVVVARIIQRYRVQMPPTLKIDLEMSFTMKAKRLPVILYEQDRNFNHSKSDISGYIRNMVEL